MKLSNETQIANLTPSQVRDYKERIKERASKDRVFFMTNILDYPLKPFQKEMISHRGSQAMGKTIQLTLLPRDSGKSWSGTVGDAVFEVCKNPNIKITLVAEALGTSMLFLSEIRQIFEKNTTMQYIFGDHVNKDRSVGSNWSTSRIVSKQRTAISKEPTIECAGATGAIVARHVDIQYLDDVVTDNTSLTDDQRQKLWRWYFKTLMPTLNQGGLQKVRGTRYQPGDMYESMIDAFGEGILYRKPALEEIEFSDDLLYVPQYTDCCPISNQGFYYRSYFPERYETGSLLEIRRADPIAFDSQYQNLVRLMLSQIIKVDQIKWVSESEWRLVLPRCFVYIGVDPATGTTPGADYFATCTIAFDPKEFRIYIIRSTAQKLGDGDAMMRQILEEWLWVRNHGGDCHGIGIEANGFQQVLANTMNKRVSEFGFLPIYKMQTIKDKVVNFIAQAHYFNRGLVSIDKFQEVLFNDLSKFPMKGMKDDRIDALVRALQLLDQGGYGGKLMNFDVQSIRGKQGVVIGF